MKMKAGVAEVGLVGQIVNCYVNVETILTIGICWLFGGGQTANHKPILWSGQLYWELYWLLRPSLPLHLCPGWGVWSLCWSSANPRCVSSITAQYGDQHLHHISTQTLRPPPPATINSLKFQSTIQNNNRKSRLNTVSMSNVCLFGGG